MNVRFRHRVEYAIVQAFRGMVRIAPRRVSLAVGSALGALFHRLHASRREVGADNLRATFPEMTEPERRKILNATFRQIGRHVIDFLNFDAMSREQMMPLIDMEGGEHVERARAEGRGVMYFAGHYGSWELQIIVHALHYSPITMIARKLDNPLLERLIEQIRTRVGTRVLPRQGATRGLLRALREGESVGMMIDQHISDRSAIRIDFLGRPAATTTAIASFALRFDAPIIPVFALPKADGRYRMVYEPPIEPPDDDDPDPIRTCTRRCTERLEARIRAEPHLWLWMHRRWR
ncbi:MAG: lysophospholipid acyltransferase family protein [Acidobacteria bacterium]|nr:lysophospholipid acyltransferase family protein [Acidobacteriota bacterium]MYD70426.1 lysophospholipid acyltransferase family protein [Acidobacteriota bacterium]MYJ05625.1 lysophospholipid acyltransferase family protein [Acidobacteriota bacterium]